MPFYVPFVLNVIFSVTPWTSWVSLAELRSSFLFSHMNFLSSHEIHLSVFFLFHRIIPTELLLSTEAADKKKWIYIAIATLQKPDIHVGRKVITSLSSRHYCLPGRCQTTPGRPPLLLHLSLKTVRKHLRTKQRKRTVTIIGKKVSK